MTESVDSRVTLYPDGKYRWVYEVPMLKNPNILLDVCLLGRTWIVDTTESGICVLLTKKTLRRLRRFEAR